MNIPNHIAIIMDGNGRWAESHGLPRVKGHINGVEAAKKIIYYARKIGIKELTLYAFSKENWARPKEEVSSLMNLLAMYLTNETKRLLKGSIRFKSIGAISDLPEKIRKMVLSVEEKTKSCNKMSLNVALSYSGREEIVDACKKIIVKYKDEPSLIEKLTEGEFFKFLYIPEMTELDLLIRTGGEYRISNFLLWQIAYTELIFLNKYWPDFSEADLDSAIAEFNKRERRFGKLSKREGY